MTRPHEETKITSILQEERVFAPPARFSDAVGGAYVRSLDEYRALHRRSLDDPEGFWGELAGELEWFKPWERLLERDLPEARWFVGGRTNLCHNAVDRHVEAGHGAEVALVWEGEPTPDGGPPELRRLTYADLQRETARLASALQRRGVHKGSVVTVYMGMVPELAVALLACARLGAVHNVIFGGFAAQAIADRMEDADSRVVLTCDGGWRRGKLVNLKDTVDEAATLTSKVEQVVVVRRTGQQIAWAPERDVWWDELVAGGDPTFPCAPLEAEDVLFLLYTSGSTGKPKGIVHTTGGYMVFAYATCKYVFNLRAGAGQLHWCTADIGWVTGHSYGCPSETDGGYWAYAQLRPVHDRLVTGVVVVPRGALGGEKVVASC